MQEIEVKLTDKTALEVSRISVRAVADVEDSLQYAVALSRKPVHCGIKVSDLMVRLLCESDGYGFGHFHFKL